MINTKTIRTQLYVLILMLLSSSVYAQATIDTTFNNLIRTESGGWVGGDATYSIFLPDGRTLWLFGDSFIGIVNADSSLAPGAKMIRNCAIIQDGDSMTSIYNGSFESPEDFASTPTPDSTWFWPEHGIVEGDTLRIMFSEFGTNDGQPGWNFEYREAYILSFTYPEIEYVSSKLLPHYQQNGVMYGDRLMNHDGYTYIYGRKEHNPDNHVPYAHIARVAEGNLMGEWEFFNGSGWSTEASSSAWITVQPVSQQFGVFPHLDKFVMITQQIWLGSKIYSLTSDSPEGPFGNVTELYSTPIPFEGMLTYNAYCHPQFDEDNELLISYNTNGDFWEIFNNIEIYRPRFIRVPYMMIDSSFTPVSTLEIPKNQMGINCYPNPSKGKITFSLNLKQDINSELIIFNVQGKEVFRTDKLSVKEGENQINLNLNHLLRGIYFYNLNGQKGKFILN